MRSFITAAMIIAATLIGQRAEAVDLNSRGQVTGCVAGGVAHIDGKAIASPAGGCNFLDDDTIVYQVCEGERCVVQAYDQRTGAKRTVWNGGANEVTAGGGVWACFCGVGVQTSTGGAYAGSYVRMNQSGSDGSFAIKVAYHSFGPWDVVEKDGSRWRLTDGDASDVTLLGNRRATWMGAGPQNNLGVAIKWLGGWWLRSAIIDGKLWVMYQNDKTGRLFLHPHDSFLGYVVGTDTLTYEPVIRVLPSGAVRAAWSVDPSETPHGTKAVTLDMSAARVDLSALVPPVVAPPVVVAPPAPAPAPAKPKLVAANKKAVVAQVIKDHPEIDSKKDSQDGRGAIVDYVAQRLNKAAGVVVWGRKSRGKPKADGTADRPNTDGLTFKRDDGLFEIYDVISGGNGGATWTGHGPFEAGENGYWARPQLGPEPGQGDGTVTPPPPPPPGDDKVAQLLARVAQLEASLGDARRAEQASGARVGELEAERDDLKGQLAAAQAERDDARRKLGDVQCQAEVRPAWAARLGAKASCSIVQ